MKKLVLIFFASILLTSISYAQHKNGLTGPEAKNYQSWKHKSEKPATVSMTNDRLTGPEAKNKALRKDRKPEQYMAVSTPGRTNLTGPKAKNMKPWQSEQADENVYTKNASDKPVQEPKKIRNREVGDDNR